MGREVLSDSTSSEIGTVRITGVILGGDAGGGDGDVVVVEDVVVVKAVVSVEAVDVVPV